MIQFSFREITQIRKDMCKFKDTSSMPRVTQAEHNFIKIYSKQIKSEWSSLGSIIFLLIFGSLPLSWLEQSIYFIINDNTIDLLYTLGAFLGLLFNLYFLNVIRLNFKANKLFNKGKYDCCPANVVGYYLEKTEDGNLNAHFVVNIDNSYVVVDKIVGRNVNIVDYLVTGVQVRLIRIKYGRKYKYIIFLM